MYALIPNKDTLFALAAVQRKLAAAFSECFAPHLVACPIYPLWALSNTALPPAISACRILAPRLVQEDGVIAFPVELVSHCGSPSPSPQSSHTDTSGDVSPSCAEGEGNHLCVPATPATQEEPSVQCGRQEDRTAVEAASASEEEASLARRRVCPLVRGGHIPRCREVASSSAGRGRPPLGGWHFLRSEDGVSPCGRTESPLVEGLAAAREDASDSQLVATLPLLWGGHPRVVDTQEGSVWQLSIVAARVLQESTGWGFAHGLSLDWQVSGCTPFPRSERVFRVGKVELEGTGWRLVRERWCKVN